MNSTSPQGLPSRRQVLAAGAAGVAGLAAIVADPTAPPTRGAARAATRAATRAAARESAGRTFHLHPDGVDDPRGGLTPETAWRSVPFLNSALASGVVRHGDTVRFARGGRFFGGLVTPEPNDPDGPVLAIGAYGEGAPPRLSAFKTAVRWAAAGEGLWSIDLAKGSVDYIGNEASPATDTGFLLVDGEVFAARKADAAHLVDQWDFAMAGDVLVVASSRDPSGHRIDMAVNEKLIVARSALLVEGLSLVGTGSHGFQTPSGTRRVVLRDCSIDLVGGSVLAGTTSRYGNGVEVWIGAADVLVEANTITRCYDTATTLQGPQSASGRGWSRVVIRNNRIADCTQSFEHWSSGTDRGEGSGAVDCRFEGNRCTGAGSGWGAVARPDKAGKSTHLLFYAVELPVGIVIGGNTFRDAAQCYSFFGVAVPPELVCDGNSIELAAGTKLSWQRPETIEQHAAWNLSTGLDGDSTFHVTL